MPAFRLKSCAAQQQPMGQYEYSLRTSRLSHRGRRRRNSSHSTATRTRKQRPSGIHANYDGKNQKVNKRTGVKRDVGRYLETWQREETTGGGGGASSSGNGSGSTSGSGVQAPGVATGPRVLVLGADVPASSYVHIEPGSQLQPPAQSPELSWSSSNTSKPEAQKQMQKLPRAVDWGLILAGGGSDRYREWRRECDRARKAVDSSIFDRRLTADEIERELDVPRSTAGRAAGLEKIRALLAAAERYETALKSLARTRQEATVATTTAAGLATSFPPGDGRGSAGNNIMSMHESESGGQQPHQGASKHRQLQRQLPLLESVKSRLECGTSTVKQLAGELRGEKFCVDLGQQPEDVELLSFSLLEVIEDIVATATTGSCSCTTGTGASSDRLHSAPKIFPKELPPSQLQLLGRTRLPEQASAGPAGRITRPTAGAAGNSRLPRFGHPDSLSSCSSVEPASQRPLPRNEGGSTSPAKKIMHITSADEERERSQHDPLESSSLQHHGNQQQLIQARVRILELLQNNEVPSLVALLREKAEALPGIFSVAAPSTSRRQEERSLLWLALETGRWAVARELLVQTCFADKWRPEEKFRLRREVVLGAERARLDSASSAVPTEDSSRGLVTIPSVVVQEVKVLQVLLAWMYDHTKLREFTNHWPALRWWQLLCACVTLKVTALQPLLLRHLVEVVGAHSAPEVIPMMLKSGSQIGISNDATSAWMKRELLADKEPRTFREKKARQQARKAREVAGGVLEVDQNKETLEALAGDVMVLKSASSAVEKLGTAEAEDSAKGDSAEGKSQEQGGKEGKKKEQEQKQNAQEGRKETKTGAEEKRNGQSEAREEPSNTTETGQARHDSDKNEEYWRKIPKEMYERAKAKMLAACPELGGDDYDPSKRTPTAMEKRLWILPGDCRVKVKGRIWWVESLIHWSCRAVVTIVIFALVMAIVYYRRAETKLDHPDGDSDSEQEAPMTNARSLRDAYLDWKPPVETPPGEIEMDDHGAGSAGN
eukprot:g6082.t1